jgi:prophage antirepressor-like protein
VSTLEQFQFPTTGQVVRTVLVGNEPWFVAADVTAILGYANGRKAVADHVESEDRDGVTIRDTMGREQTPTAINESGLYALIFGSRLDTSRAFKRWVTSEVLPALRKHGTYSIPQQRVELSRRDLAQMVIEEADRADAAEARAAELAPDADHWRVLASGDGDYCVADAAKILSRDPAIKTGRNRLFVTLGELGWAYRQAGDQAWRVYQSAIDTGRLSEIPQSHYHPRTGELVLDPPQIRVTAKGIADLRARLGGTNTLAIEAA